MNDRDTKAAGRSESMLKWRRRLPALLLALTAWTVAALAQLDPTGKQDLPAKSEPAVATRSSDEHSEEAAPSAAAARTIEMLQKSPQALDAIKDEIARQTSTDAAAITDEAVFTASGKMQRCGPALPKRSATPAKDTRLWQGGRDPGRKPGWKMRRRSFSPSRTISASGAAVATGPVLATSILPGKTEAVRQRYFPPGHRQCRRVADGSAGRFGLCARTRGCPGD